MCIHRRKVNRMEGKLKCIFMQSRSGGLIEGYASGEVQYVKDDWKNRLAGRSNFPVTCLKTLSRSACCNNEAITETVVGTSMLCPWSIFRFVECFDI